MANSLLSSLTVSFLSKRLQDNHNCTMNSSNQTMFPKYSKRARSCTLPYFLWTCFISIGLPWYVMKYFCSYFVNGVSKLWVPEIFTSVFQRLAVSFFWISITFISPWFPIKTQFSGSLNLARVSKTKKNWLSCKLFGVI